MRSVRLLTTCGPGVPAATQIKNLAEAKHHGLRPGAGTLSLHTRFTVAACLSFLALANPVQAAKSGQEVFRAKCIGCHAIACNRSGPKLAGILGRKAGSVADFTGYTKEMKSAGFEWSRERLDKFLADPGAMVAGTTMASAGRLSSASDRKRVIDFIVSGDTSLDLCF